MQMPSICKDPHGQGFYEVTVEPEGEYRTTFERTIKPEVKKSSGWMEWYLQK